MSRWLRHGLLVGRTELRRSVRGLLDDRLQLAMIGVGTLVMVLFSGVAAVGIVVFGGELAGHALPPAVGGWLVVMWGFIAYMSASRGASQHDRIDAEPLVLTTTSPRAVATGIVSAEIARGVAYAGLPAVLVTGGFAYATGSPLFLAIALPALGAAYGTAALVGYGIGIGAALAIARSRWVARYKTYLAVALLIVVLPPIFYAFSGQLDYALLAWVPLAWYADLIVLGAPIEGSTLRAVGAVAFTGVLAIGGGWAVDRLTTAYWFTDPVEVDDGRAARTPGASSLEAAVGRLPLPLGPIGRPSRTVVLRTLVQTWRNPSKLWLQLLVVVAFVPSLATGGGGGAIAWGTLAPAAAVLVPWLAGSLFGLNPLGDEGDALPATLTSTITGRAYVRGFLAVSLVVGLPLSVLAIVGTAIPAPYDPLETAGLLALGLAALAASAPLALALGMRFPRFGALSGGWGDREVVPPSLTAMFVHVLVLGIVAGGGTLAWVSPAGARAVVVGLVWLLVLLPAALAASRGVDAARTVADWGEAVTDAIAALSAASVRIAVAGSALVVLLAVAALSYWYAVRRFEAYTVD